MKEHVKLFLFVAVVGLLLWATAEPGTFGPITKPTTPTTPPVVVPVVKPDAVTFVYEKDSHAVPSGVMAALNTLNRAGILATIFEQDTKDGTEDTPEQYKIPLAAAQQAGLPALVVTAGNKVLKVVKDPKTKEQVIEAAK